MMADSTAIYDSRSDVENEEEFVKLWLDQISRSSDEEKDWRDEAEEAEKTYRGDKATRNTEFNIFHANVETMVPALYNSTPIPDVRRRFADPDPVGKVVSDIIERSLSYAVDAYDFDGVMVACVKDSEIVDRGVARVRYVPQIAADSEGNEKVTGEDVTCEHVLWREFRRGPGRYWSEVPWIAFRHYLSKDELAKLVADAKPKINIEDIQLNYSSGGAEKNSDNAKSDVFRRGLIWEIWDKESRRVIFVSPDYRERVLKMQDDPLGLEGFYPVPKPLSAIEQTSKMVPIVPLKVYEHLVTELNDITRRLRNLIKTLRPRGLYGGNVLDITAASDADDGELAPATDVMAFLQNGGLDKAISWFPLDPTVMAIKTLYEQREVVKQTIYEVTGIADIIRGATNPNETLGAQQLKSQWGSLRIQRRQSEVARFARDLFELKAEIICSRFQWDHLSAMTGIDLPTMQQKQAAQAMLQKLQGVDPQQVPPAQQAEQAKKIASVPSREEVMQLLQDDATRNYRIDIESDSTIRNDMARNQQAMNLFLQGTAQFATAMGPLVMTDPSMKAPVLEIYGAFARQFKLGRQAEDALDAVTTKAQETADQPPPPNPQVEAEKAKQVGEQQKMQMELQFKQQEHQMKLQQMQAELEMKREELNLKAQELQMKERELGMKVQAAQQQAAIDQQSAQRQAEIDGQAMERKAQLDERTATLQAETIDKKHQVGLEMIDAKAKAAKSKPNGARK